VGGVTYETLSRARAIQIVFIFFLLIELSVRDLQFSAALIFIQGKISILKTIWFQIFETSFRVGPLGFQIVTKNRTREALREKSALFAASICASAWRQPHRSFTGAFREAKVTSQIGVPNG
jgi:hypothetical protein